MPRQPTTSEARSGLRAPADDPGRRVPLAGGWGLWPWICLRGAGFAADRVLALAAADVDRHLDELEARCGALERARREALAACETACRHAGREELSVLRRSRRKLRSGRFPDGVGLGPEPAAALARLHRADEACRATEERLAEYLARERVRLGNALRDEARDERFREALGWQNRRALRTGIDALLRQPPGAGDAHTRQHELLVARYLQRYAVKNDTVSFFGPIGWGTAAAEGPAIEVRPGPALVSERSVCFEHWAIAALAERLARQVALRPWLRPRRLPTVRVEQTILHLPDGRRVRLSAELAWLLATCDGERTTRELARAMLAEPALGVGGEEEVYQLIERGERRGLLVWTFEIPTEDAHPENALRRQLEAIDAPALRAPALDALDELVARREAVARAAGDAGALERAMSELEATFGRLTGREATRQAGKTYAGRSLVYEDCRRDVELVIGPPVLDRIAPALRCVLTSARWFTHAVAVRFRARCEEAYEALRRETGDRAVDGARFLSRIEPSLAADQYQPSPLIRAVGEELHQRWGPLLGPLPDGGEIALRSEDLGPRVDAAFAAPGPGWPMARYHSPDLLLAAASREAIRRGEFTPVLGEIHPSCNTLLSPVLLARHPHPQLLLQAREIDVPERLIAPVMPQQSTHRAAYHSRCERDFHLEIGATRSWRPRSQVVEVSQLVVEKIDGRLLVRTRCGELRFDVVAFFEHFLVGGAGHLTILPPAARSPRVTIDALVIARECWRFAPDELTFAKPGPPERCLVEANRWARGHGIPRFVFAKVPEEPKPVYVDFHSPLYVEIFVKLVRKASAVRVTEMLPRHGENWLTDREGARYTCELRIAAVDPLPWNPTLQTALGAA